MHNNNKGATFKNQKVFQQITQLIMQLLMYQYTDPAENISIGGVISPDLTSSLEVKSIVCPAPSWFFSPLSTNLSGAM